MAAIWIWEAALDLTSEKDIDISLRFTKGAARQDCQKHADKYETSRAVTRTLAWENVGPRLSRATHPNGYDSYYVTKRKVT